MGYPKCSNQAPNEDPATACCAEDEICCGDGDDRSSKKDGTICCKKKTTECSKTSMGKGGYTTNYCKVKGCDETKEQKCTTLLGATCCKKEPKEYCGKQNGAPYCATFPQEIDKCPEGYENPPCYENKGTTLCCKDNGEEKETCITDPYFGGQFCSAISCKHGQPCTGVNDWIGFNLCCDKGETCFRHGDGWPRCVTEEPAEQYQTGQSIATSSFSIYLSRIPSGDEFERTGIAYRFQPHGLQFQRDVSLLIKDYKAGEVLYKYPDESFIDNCHIDVLNKWSIVVGAAGGLIDNAYFRLQIPAYALNKNTEISIDQIKLACAEDERPFQGPSTNDMLEIIDRFYQGMIGAGDVELSVADWQDQSEAPQPDTQPPSVPANLMATAASANAIALNWAAATDNVWVTGYKVYRNGALVNTTTALNYIDSGLAAKTNYTYQVSAVDAGGNESAKSTSVNATTFGVPDAITNLSAVAGNTKVTLNWSAPNIGGTAILRYKVEYGTVASAAFATKVTDDATPGIIISGLTNGTAYQFRIYAENAVGAAPMSNVAKATPISSVQTPWKTNQNGTLTTNIAWNYTMGYHFIPQQSGTITKLGGFFNGTKTVYLWNRTTGALLAQANVTSANSWSYVNITPVKVVAGQTYTVAAYLAGSGASQRASISAFPKTYGSIQIIGTTYNTGNQRPTYYITSIMYGQADIEFVPD